MTGEALALLSALFYGLAGVTVVRARPLARGDNGVFLSVLVTTALTLLLWLGWGAVPLAEALAPRRWPALALFALAGLFSTVLGRITLYRATERIGAVRASLLRRLIPVFALPVAAVLLHERPDASALLGGALVLVAVFLYLNPAGRRAGRADRIGDLLGIASAASYALAYGLRRLGLGDLPDPAFGTFAGAAAGAVWMLGAASLGRSPRSAIARLTCDRSRWHWITALALSLGQTLQFFALKAASVASVAVLGSLELFFSAVLVGLVFRTERIPVTRLLLTGSLAVMGTALVML